MENSKNRMLFITNLCAPYRVGLFELLAKRYKIKFLFFSAGEERYYDGPSVTGNFDNEYLSGFYLLPKVKINPKLIKMLLFGNYTHIIISLNGPIPVLLSFLIGKLRGKKIILWSSFWRHPSTLFHKFSFPIVKFLYKKSNAIVVYGTHIQKYLESIGVEPAKIFIGWQVQNNKKFLTEVTSQQREKLKRRLEINNNKVILFVGRLVEVKGLPYLVDAFKKLNNQQYTLLIIGSGPDEKLIDTNYTNIIHLQKISAEQLYLYYNLADVFVLPSITTDSFKENWGFVVNEAMCQRCAIITSDAVGAGVGGLIEEGRNGYIVPEKDSEQLSIALERILSDDKLLASMQQRSLEIISEWTYEKQASGFIQAINFANNRNSNE
ncbi:MAG TPA: glycosyltransferase family 4 protein [Chitinophagaceae bacterium]|jgi:glycosyltransferase involved in cell wall biosynthesis|nr:glycosyltransferase family 4 protein [Chitinophagaceae bacterium]